VDGSRPRVDGIAGKLARAETHLETLERAIHAYLSPPEPYVITGEEYMEGDIYSQRMFLEVREFPPDEEWGPLIGDVVHNLRSALDHLAWELALPQVKATSPDKVGFPISRPRRNKETARWIANRAAMFPERTRAIIEGLQPHETGDSLHPLWVLQKLWNADKHRTIHTAGFAFIATGSSTSDHPLDLPGSWTHGRFEARRQPMAYRGGKAPQGSLHEYLRVWAHSAKDVTFGYPGELPSPEYPFAGAPILRTLRRIQKVVATEAVKPLRRFVA
jgi:hypothetical protein